MEPSGSDTFHEHDAFHEHSEICLGFIERWLHYGGRLQCFSAILVPFGAREAGCFREVAALQRQTAMF